MTQAKTPYRLRAHWLETCNCDPGCNCNFGGFPNHGSCEGIIAFEVVEGNYGSVDMAGVQAVVVLKFPKAVHDGNGQSALFIDESARPEQVEGLTSILSGKEGGMPWEILASMVTSAEGPHLRPIEMKIDGRNSSFRIPGVLEASLTPLLNPVTGEDNEVHVSFPNGGLIWNEGQACTTATMQVDHGDLKYGYPGMSAYYALANWSNQQ